MASPPTTLAKTSDAPASGDPATVAQNSFPRAARENRRPMADDTHTISASSVAAGPYDVPPFGFLRHLVLIVTMSGAAKGSATVAMHADGPWSCLQNLQLIDVNGAPLVGPMSGYDLYLANKYGAYVANSDPALAPSYSAPDVNGNFVFKLRVPVEISARDALGALPNMTASSTYKLQYMTGTSAQIYSTPPDTLGTLRVEATLESWTQPPPADFAGVANKREPIAVGTTQFWTKHSVAVNSGSNRIQVKRVGNLLRTLVLVWRTTGGARQSVNWPDPLIVEYDGRNEDQAQPEHLADQVYERYGFAHSLGNFVYDFHHDLDGRPGFELRNGYLPTTQATDLELIGTFGGAGSLDILVNDVAPAGGVFGG